MKKYASYIIVFLLTVSVYLFVQSNKQIKENEFLKKGLSENVMKNLAQKDSLNYFKAMILELRDDDFSLNNNQDAQDYLYDFYGDGDWNRYILDKLMETNETKGDNPLIPYAGMSGNMKISNAKVLNHRWIIANFTDGKYWGEMLIRFYINKNKKIRFKVLDQDLYN